MAGVVTGLTRRRWLAVGAGVATLCALPAGVAAWPQPDVRVAPDRLRELIMASGDRAYQGYADSRGQVGLPDLPELSDVSALLAGSSRLRVWYGGARAWRVAVVHPTGERDIYRTDDATFLWDFERNLLTRIDGDLPVRLPWAADLPPPELARRLLGHAAAGDAFTSIGSLRVAGVAAAGLRFTPADQATTIGHVDVWADPRTGLPVRVVVAGRSGGTAVLLSRFLELRQQAPDPALLVPSEPAAAGFATAYGPDIAATINGVLRAVPPPELAGQPRQTLDPFAAVAAYGTGLPAFVVVALPGRYGSRALSAARDAGGAEVTFPDGTTGYELRTSVLSTLAVRSPGDRINRRTYLLAGMVVPQRLRQAAADLVAAGPGAR